MVGKKRIAAGMGLVVLLGIGLSQSWRGRTGSVTVEMLSQHDSRKIWALDRSPASGEWQRRYRFRREISATTVEKDGTQKSILKFDLRGTLDLARQGAWVRAQFQLEKSKEHPGIVSSIPFYFSMNAAGELTEIRSSGDADQQSILKDLALLFAYRTRLDTAGEVESTFRDSETDGVAEIVKQKIQYSGQIGKVVKIKKSEHRIRKDLSLFAGVEVTEMGQIETSSKYQLKLEKMESTVSNRINPDLVLQYAVLPLLHAESGTGEGRPVLSWKVLKSQLARIGKSSSAHRMKLFHEFIRTLRQDPQAFSEFKQWMSSRRSDGREGHRDFVYGVGVLGAMGTAEAQSQLVAFHLEYSDPAILNSLTTMKAPMTAETRDFLKGLTASPKESESFPALLALGSSLRVKDASDRQPASSDSRAAGGSSVANAASDEDVVSLILARYRNAQLVSERMEVLDAMGNSGSERFLPVISSVIFDSRSPEMLVTKAIFAMRLMTSPEARGLLDRLSSDQSFASYQSIITSALNHLPSLAKR